MKNTLEENIKNFIEESEKEFEKQFVYHCSDGDLLGKDDDDDKEVKRCKKFISSRQISLIKMIVEYCNDITIRELRDSSDMRAYNPSVANRLPITRLTDKYSGGWNEALDTISSKLKELTDSK